MLAKANTNKLLVIFSIVIILLLILNFIFVITVKGDVSDQSTSSSNRSLSSKSSLDDVEAKLSKILDNQAKLMVTSIDLPKELNAQNKGDISRYIFDTYFDKKSFENVDNNPFHNSKNLGDWLKDLSVKK